MCDSGCTASSASRSASRRLDALAAEPVVGRHRGLERADPRRALGMARHVVREVRVVAEPGRGGHAGTVRRNGPARRSRRRRSRGRRALRGAVRRPRGRARHARLRPPARRDRLLLGAGRPRRRARRRRLAAAPPRGHARRRPRDRAPLGRRGALRGGAGALPRPRAARRALRRRPPRPPRARPRGRPRRPPRRARGRRARPAAGSCASCRRVVAEHERIDVLEGRRAAALAMDGRRRADPRRRPRDRRPRRRARHGRRRRAVVAHDQPAGRPSAPG